MTIILIPIAVYLAIGVVVGGLFVYVCGTQLTDDIGELTKIFFISLVVWPYMVVAFIMDELRDHGIIEKGNAP